MIKRVLFPNMNGDTKYPWAINTALEFLAIDSVDNDVINLDDGRMIALLSVKPINLKNASEKKKKEINKRYLDWLDSLDYPVQIVSRSIDIELVEQFNIMMTKIDHDLKIDDSSSSSSSSLLSLSFSSSLSSLSSSESKELLSFFKEFSTWAENYIKSSKPKRLFFIAIPYIPPKRSQFSYLSTGILNVKKRKKELLIEDANSLNERVEQTKKLLSKTGVGLYRLSSENMKELLMSYFVLGLHSGSIGDIRFEKPARWLDKFKHFKKEEVEE